MKANPVHRSIVKEVILNYMRLFNKKMYLVILTGFTVFMVISAVRPIQPLFMLEVGATEVEISMIFAISSGISLIARIIIGALSNRIGRRNMIIITSLIQFSYMIMFFIVNDVIWLYFIMTLQLLTFAFFGPSAISLISDEVSSNRIGKVMGTYYTFMGLGQFLGPLISGILTEYLKFRQIFLILSILPIVGLIATIQWKSTKKSENIVYRKNSEEDQRIMNSFRNILRTRNVIGICLSRITWTISTVIINTLFPIWAKNDLLFTTYMVSILFSASGAINAFIRMPVGIIVKKVGLKKLLILCYSLAAIAFLIFSLTSEFIIFLVAMILFGLAWGIGVVSDGIILTISVNPKDKSLAIAIASAVMTVGNSLGSYTTGVLYNVLSISTIFQISSTVLLLGVFILIVTIREKQFIMQANT